MEELYKLENVNKIYKDNENNHALKDVDLIINKGEIIVILGPSGSGKSTLLNILSGIDNPTSGKVYFMNERIDKLDANKLTEYRAAHLGFIFQSYNLVSNLTVKENIELGARLSKTPLKIKEVVKMVGLSDQINKYPFQLSGGQMQRVAISRAVAKNPDVLFCDEPTGALDEAMGKKVLAYLQDINKKYNTTMIIVTHNPSIALIGNTVIKLNSGSIVEIKKNKKTIEAADLRWA